MISLQMVTLTANIPRLFTLLYVSKFYRAMEYYLGTVTYKSPSGEVHHNTSLLKASSQEEAANGLKKNAFDKGVTKENLIKVEIYNTILCK